MQSEFITCKPKARSIASLVDHGNLPEIEAKQILSSKLPGSFLIIDGLKEKHLLYKVDDKTIVVEENGNIDVEKRSDLRRPVLANPLIQKKSEVVNLISQMVFITDPSILAQLKEEVTKIKKSDTYTFDINGHVFILRRGMDKNSPKAIEINKMGDEFNKGAFGILYNIESINVEEERAVKMAMDNKPAKIFMKNEIELLKEVGGSEGIQMAPYAVIEYTNKQGVSHIGYLTLKYPKNGNDFAMVHLVAHELGIDLPIESHAVDLILIRQLIAGLKKLHQDKIYHGDINPDNILSKQDALVLADFGGALKFEDKKKQFEEFVKKGDFSNVWKLFVPCHPNFVSNYLMEKTKDKLSYISKMAENCECSMIELINLERDILGYLFANDEFSLGLSLYIMLTGTLPPFNSFEKGNEKLATGQGETSLETLRAVSITMREKLEKKVLDETLVEDIIQLIIKGI